ncbi:MAG: NADH:flavin oxidoreductase [Deltaproteobacteria bacterium]|nr:NADH:flavin oxidoreductase [Deltaproteobacteria bacterium]
MMGEKMEFSHLFEPIRIGKVDIRNRIAMAPMVTQYADHGNVSEQQLAYYGARARGGVGLIVVEHVLASKWAEDTCPSISLLRLYEPGHMAGFAELVDTIHAFGAKAFIQLNAGVGVQGSSSRTGVQPVGPSVVSYRTPPEMVPRNCRQVLEAFLAGEAPREMSIEEIEREQESFARAAMMARAVGFDGLEIHAAHGFLLHEFLSPRFNLRTDRYGGTLENRMRFLLELVRKTKAAVGDGMAVGVRASADEHVSGGTTYEDMKVVVKRLEQEGIDYFHVGDGCFDSLKYIIPDDADTMLEEGAGFKKLLNLPVLTPTVHDPRLAEKAVREGMTDMISLGRQLIADPEWTNKVRSGKVSAITRCSRCNIGCYARIFGGLRIKCVRNPESGLERYNPAYTQLAAMKDAVACGTGR